MGYKLNVLASTLSEMQGGERHFKSIWALLAILGVFFVDFYTFQNNFPSTAVAYENAVTLFCSEAPGTTSKLYQTFHRHVSE